jgi:HD-like signal output (HDOD) protein
VAGSDEHLSPLGLWARIRALLHAWFVEQFSPRQTHLVRKKPRIRSVPGPSGGGAVTEARARRTLAQPARPQLVEEPGASGVAPWEGGGVALSIDPDEVRPHLMESLFEIQDQCETEAGKAFLNRLIRMMASDQLDLPPFPDVAWQLDTLLRLGDPPLVRVVKLVRREAALVRRVWTQACSAFYARPPNSLDHAVARIGFDALWRIGMSACLYSEVFRVRGFQEDADAVRRHGIIAADVAAWLSGKKLGAAYLAGLLHGVGKLMVYRAASTTRPVGLPDPELVEDVAAELHPAIGVLVAHSWKLGPEVAAGIGFQHDPARAPPEYQEIAMQVQVSNIATYTAEFSRHGQDCGGLLTLLSLEGLDFDVARTIGKAHEIMDGLEQQPDAASQPVLDVVEKP